MAPLAGLIPSRTWLLPAVPIVIAGCSTMTGCDDKVSAQNAKVKISGQSFYLETALDDAKRFRGLSERTAIEDNGGMLFVFPDTRSPALGGFVMRDCPIGIDIIYVDKGGRVVSMYEMVPEVPRDATKGEGTPADANNPVYNSRLKQYISRYPYNFVIELKQGSLKKLSVKEGDLIDFDRESMLKQSK
jgi:uncharacterized membrane protein (UPF0127 family)